VIFNPPPWAERNLGRYWDAIQAVVGPDRMPQGPGSEELGCAHYGCVWGTMSGQVMKVTSDPTEARCAQALIEMGNVRGIVGYHEVYQLPGVTFRNRPVFVLWRDLAWNVGGLLNMQGPYYGELTWDQRETREALDWLDAWNLSAADLRRYLQDRQRRVGDAAEISQLGWEQRGNQPHWNRGSSLIMPPEHLNVTRWERRRLPKHYHKPTSHPYRGADRVGIHLAAAEHIVIMMQTSLHHLSNVGTAFEACLEAGILLADVHANNIGLIVGPDEDRPFPPPAQNPGPDERMRELERAASGGDPEARGRLIREWQRQQDPRAWTAFEPEGYELAWGITDPGHAMFLSDQWQNLAVPLLPGA
jgi:hypothetical protein